MKDDIKKIYTFYNEDFGKLKENFLKSLKDDIEVDSVLMDTEFSGKMAGGYGLWVFKTKFILDAIRKNLGSIIVVSDVDIEFVRPISGIIKECMRDKDIVFQINPQPSEGPINIGFMSMKCNWKIFLFWKLVLYLVRHRKLHDQFIVNRLFLGKFRLILKHLLRIRYGFFPFEVWANGPGEDWNRKIPKEISLFHATWVISQEEKLALMDKVLRPSQSLNVKIAQ